MMRILYFLFLLTVPVLSLAQPQPEGTTSSNNITAPAPEENLLDNISDILKDKEAGKVYKIKEMCKKNIILFLERSIYI